MEFDCLLDNVNLKPGHKLYFERIIASEKIKISGAYVGCLGDKYILAEMPVSKRGPLFQFTDTKCTVRFIKDGSVYGFSTEVVAITHNPIPMIYLSFPIKLEKLNLRKEDRYRVSIPVRLGLFDTEILETPNGTVIDISKSGCRIITPFFCDSGDKITIEFDRVNGSKHSLAGEVKNATPNGLENYALGVEFGQNHDFVDNFVERLEDAWGIEK